MMNSLDDDDNVALAETATIGGGAAANLCGGGRKSSSKTGEPGESLSSLTVNGSVGVRCLGRPPPNASLKVHQVAKTSGGTLFRLLGKSGVATLGLVGKIGGGAVNPLLAVGAFVEIW